MFRKWLHTLLTILPVFLCGLALLLPDTAAAQVKRPAVLMLGYGGKAEVKLREMGFQTKVIAPVSLVQQPNLVDLKKFHIILVSTMPIPSELRDSPYQLMPKNMTKLVGLLTEYMNAGGSILFYGPWGGYDGANEFLKPLGASVLVNEAVDDPVHSYRQPDYMKATWNYTENISPGPWKEKVERIFWARHEIYNPACHPIKATPEWKIIARGMPSARSCAWNNKGGAIVMPEIYFDKPMTYPSAPPIAATRDAGAGRVTVVTLGATQNIYGYEMPHWGNIPMVNGAPGLPSQGWQFLVNLLQYTAERSLNQPAPPVGGYQNEPLSKRMAQPSAPIDWTNPAIQFPRFPAKPFRGIYGARTAASGGTGTVAEYVAAAKAAGLDFIGFMEDFTKLTPEAWDKFRAECTQATDANFLAIPGLAIARGRAGTPFFKIGDYAWPVKSVLTDDGKALKEHLVDIFRPGGYCTVGPYELPHANMPVEMHRAYTCMAIVTVKDGKPGPEAVRDFALMNNRADLVRPVVIDRIDSPQQVAAAAKRFVNLYWQPNLESARKTILEPGYGWAESAQGISGGPVITNWTGINTHRSSYGQYIPGTERSRVRLEVKSDKPLKEVLIYDGTEVVRRYTPTGNEFSVDTEFLFDRIRFLVPVVHDTAGGLAIAGPLRTGFDYYMYRTMCSDRSNSLAGSWAMDETGAHVDMPSTFMQYTANMRMMGPSAPSDFDPVPPMWDGGCGRQGELSWSPQPYGEAESTGRVGDRIGVYISSGDVQCQTSLFTHQSDKPAFMLSHGSEYVPMVPLTKFNARQFYYDYQKFPRSPGVTLIEGTLTMLEDGVIGGYSWYTGIPLIGNWSSPDARNAILFAVPGQPLVAASATEKGVYMRSRPLPPDGVAAFWGPGWAQAFVSLTPNINFGFDFHTGWLRGTATVGAAGEKYTKGQTWNYRYALIASGYDEPGGVQGIERLRREFGLSGEPAYKLQVSRGKVKGTRLLLELDAQDGGFVGDIAKADLCMPIPIRLSGLNPAWTAVVVERSGTWYRPIPVRDGIGHLSLDTRKADQALFIGHPITCDRKDIRLTLIPNGKGQFGAELHNPTDKEVKTFLRVTPDNGIFPVRAPVEVTIPAGASITL